MQNMSLLWKTVTNKNLRLPKLTAVYSSQVPATISAVDIQLPQKLHSRSSAHAITTLFLFAFTVNRWFSLFFFNCQKQ